MLWAQVQEETWLEHQSSSVELRSQRLRTPPAHNNKLLTTKLLQATFMGHVHFSTFPSLYEEDNNNNNVIVVIIIFKQTITMIISKWLWANFIAYIPFLLQIKNPQIFPSPKFIFYGRWFLQRFNFGGAFHQTISKQCRHKSMFDEHQIWRREHNGGLHKARLNTRIKDQDHIYLHGNANLDHNKNES